MVPLPPLDFHLWFEACHHPGLRFHRTASVPEFSGTRRHQHELSQDGFKGSWAEQGTDGLSSFGGSLSAPEFVVSNKRAWF